MTSIILSFVMEKNNDNDNDNKNVSKLPISKTTEVTETVEKPKKTKRKFEWTPKRKAAFEKCVAARKNQIQPKRKTVRAEDSSDSSVTSSLSSSSEEYKKPKRKGLKKQFYRLKKDLIYNMKKQLKKKNVYNDDDDDDDFDLADCFPSSYPQSVSHSRPNQQSQPHTQQPNQTQEEKPQPTKPKYCFI
jgi:hypothetical protein